MNDEYYFEERTKIKEMILKELFYYEKELAELQSSFIELLELKDTYPDEVETIHVNLSVIQLGALFRILKELGILEKTEASLARLITLYFQTKAGSGSPGSMRNALGKVEKNLEGLEYWREQLPRIEKIIDKLIIDY